MASEEILPEMKQLIPCILCSFTVGADGAE